MICDNYKIGSYWKCFLNVVGRKFLYGGTFPHKKSCLVHKQLLLEVGTGFEPV